MTIQLRPATTSEAKPMIGLYAESGAGKTYSALLLAKGFAGDMSQVAMIETESGRGEVFADDPVVGGYNVVSIRNNFGPKEYGSAISVVEKANMRAMIIDSASHEWEGAGGVLSLAAANQQSGKKGPLVWQQPKLEHQREFMLRLMQTPVPLVIVCMRAKYPMYEVTAADVKKWEEAGRPGKQPKVGDWARSWKLDPKQADDILFEMMVHAWIDSDHKLHVTKWTKEVFKTIFVDGQPITIETGQRLAAWAAGRTAPKAIAPSSTPASRASAPQTQRTETSGAGPVYTTEQIVKKIEAATTPEALGEAADLARGLKEQADRDTVNAAYKKRLNELRSGNLL